MNIYPFVESLKTRLNEYKTRMNYTYFKEFDVLVTEGGKFFKVYCFEIFNDGKVSDSKRIVCFIDKVTGDIYKPASFRAPAKHARGNVLSSLNGMEAIDDSGFVKYLK
jgi:hypothetical protein